MSGIKGIMKAGAVIGTERTEIIREHELAWQLNGLCRGQDSRLWFPRPPDMELKEREAKKTCHECPVINQCAAWALNQREAWGIWGGLSENDREAIHEGKATLEQIYGGRVRTRKRRYHVRSAIATWGEDD